MKKNVQLREMSTGLKFHRIDDWGALKIKQMWKQMYKYISCFFSLTRITSHSDSCIGVTFVCFALWCLNTTRCSIFFSIVHEFYPEH